MGGRILIIQLAKLGDFIQSTPLLANIGRQWPGAELVVAASDPAVIEAARLSPLIGAVIEARENGPPPEGPYKAVFNLNSHRRAAALAARVDAEKRYGPVLRGDELHFTPAQNFLMAMMGGGRRALGRLNLVDLWASLCPGAEPLPLCWPSSPMVSDLLSGAEGLKVGFQLGSRNHLRRWPTEHFADLARRLNGAVPLTATLLGASPEKSLGARFEKLAAGGVKTLNLIGRTDLKELGAVLAGLDLLVTADTGVMHLAAAVGLPTLALFFGPAFGPETGPYGPGHLIYQALAPCAPCRENAGCRLRHCRQMPLAEIAARAALALLGRGAAPAELPPGHRLWRTAADSFGQTLIPLGRPPLNGDEAAALVMGEAGRAVARPGYGPSPAAAQSLVAHYSAVRERPRVAGSIFKIAAARLPDPLGAAFLNQAIKLTGELGFVFADK